MSDLAASDAEERRLDEASAWCLQLAEGELDLPTRERFEAWLEADPLNREAFEDAVGAWRAVDETGLWPEVIGLRTRALESFRGARQSRFSRRTALRAWMGGAIAAGLLLVVGSAFVWTQGLPRTYQTGVGERRVIALADGSKLSLDASTTVEVRYSRDKRRLRLETGRARFEVAKDPLRPFSVAAADKLVVATGTEFSVELLRRQVRVVLLEGHVVVLDKTRPVKLAATGRPADQSLTPGRELVSSVDAPVAKVAPIDTARSLSWEAGQLVFVDEPLASAVERMNRYSAVKLDVADAPAGDTLVSGVFTAGDTQAFVEGVTGVLPLQVAEADGKKVFRRRSE